MAWTPPGAGQLRQRAIFLRRPVQDRGGQSGDGDGAGNFEGELVELCRRDVRLSPRMGGEEVIAGRLQGVDSWELVVRACSKTRTLGAGDVVRDARDERQEFNIRSALSLDAQGRWIVMALERGVAVG